ncbi:mast/stem cell growth factor receptor kita-like [Megalops cyprinoides]|uniref:mast/stem cell growth factor receptor kita-like n=1 Tax=Megalops cyprinoides TaxID=118141 RepID=UPI001863CDD9|nr:mast/stem cell growth factor receptor kita-like [Megalops cyprinoides]
MAHTWAHFTALFLFLAQRGDAGELGPFISPRGPHLVVPKGSPISLRCHDDSRVKWQRENRRRVDGEVQEFGSAIISIPTAQAQHMGRYLCTNERGAQSVIYIFVKDHHNAFQRSVVRNILVKSGHSAVVPCLATDPALRNLTLHTCDGHALLAALSFSSSVEKGITILNVQKAQEGCYTCTGQLGGKTVMSSQYQLIVSPVPESIPSVSLSEKEMVILTENQKFEVMCSSTNVNNDFRLEWKSPLKVQASVSNSSSSLPGSGGFLHRAVLSVPSVRMQHSGRYTCTALNEVGVATASVQLDVQERGFINLTEAGNSTVHVRAGETLSLRLALWAYPRPHTLSWEYMGHALQNTSDHIITSQHLGYRSISVLSLVRIKGTESGIYTFHAKNADVSVSRSFTIHVISKPEIISQEGPIDGQVRCIAAGFPTPEITWFYCELPHTRCSHQLNSTQEQQVSTVTVSSPEFGRRMVESHVNISRGHFHTLECVATVEGEEAFSLFSVGERMVPHKLFTPLLVGFVSAAALLSVGVLVLLHRYLQKPKYQIHWKVIEGIHGNSYVYIDPTQLPYDPKWEFPRDNLRFGKTLGSGAFGKVVEATAYGMMEADTVMTVAVKMLKPSAHATEKEALMSELKVLSYLGHHMNIVNLLGACTVGGPTLVITEYCCFGDLLNFLRRNRDAFLCLEMEESSYRNIRPPTVAAGDINRNGYLTMRPAPSASTAQACLQPGSFGDKDMAEDTTSLHMEDLLSFSYQVAKGMDFLASRNCIHRDLAARNVLLTKGRVAKICDFGLARDITTDSNYVVKGNARLPVKWMSPESIFECVYTLESDVWSYGILLWEIFSLGSSPYPGMPVSSVFYKRIREGYRMREPEFAPSEMYEVMKSCWEADPLKRPSFRKIVEKLEVQLLDRTKRIYMNINSSSFPCDQQQVHFPRLNSGGSITQPLLQDKNDVFLECET